MIRRRRVFAPAIRTVSALDTPDYQQLEQKLQAAGAPLGAAEAHGLLCGLAGAAGALLPQLWLGEALADCDPEKLLVAECRTSLESLYRATAAALDGPGLEARPLLPADDRPLTERSGALAAWCQGFLYGLGLSGMDEARLSPESLEALHDLGQLAALASDDQESDESEAAALEELVEFAWVAFMLIFHDLVQESNPPL
jgi:yecA family protein